MSVLLADPVRMMEMGAPRLIESDEQLAQYTKVLFNLTAKENPTADEIDAINLLSMLVERYEAERFPVRDVSSAEMLRYLMELKEIRQDELIPVIGSESAVASILDGESSLTVLQIKALGAFFRVSQAVFLPTETD